MLLFPVRVDRVTLSERWRASLPRVILTTTSGSAIYNWRLRCLVLLIARRGGCSDDCARALYATRQARTIQGREQDRVVRLLLQPLPAPAPPQELAAADPGLLVVSIEPHALEQLPLGQSAAGILLLDPRGNLVLRYGPDPDIRRLANDLQRVLKASQIG